MSYMSLDNLGGYYRPMGGLAGSRSQAIFALALAQQAETAAQKQVDDNLKQIAVLAADAQNATRALEDEVLSIERRAEDTDDPAVYTALQRAKGAAAEASDGAARAQDVSEQISTQVSSVRGTGNWATAIAPKVRAALEEVQLAVPRAQIREAQGSLQTLAALVRQSEVRAEQTAQAQAQAQADREAALAAQRAEEQRYLEQQAQAKADREAAIAAQRQTEAEQQRYMYELRMAELEAQREAEREEREYQRAKAEQATAVAESAPPPWLQELLSSLALKAGPSAVPMATAPPVQAPEVYAYDPSGQPVDAYGNVIPTSYAPVYPSPPSPPVPSYYTPQQPTATQAPVAAPPASIPGSPFELVPFNPSGAELFGLGQSQYAGEAGKLRVQADELDAKAAGVAAADPNYAQALRQQASALRREANAMEGHAGPGPSTPTSAEPEGPGVLDSIANFIKQLTPVAESAYSTYQTGQKPVAPQPTKAPAILTWILPIGLAGLAVWGVSKLVK